MPSFSTIATFLFAISGCASDTPTPPTLRVTSTAMFIVKYGTAQFTATATPMGGGAPDRAAALRVR